MTPKRIHFNRHNGEKLPEGAKLVTRATKWGNPAKIGALYEPWGRAIADNREACEAYRQHLAGHPEIAEAAKRELRGFDLACACPEGEQDCHARILLEVANPPPKDCRATLNEQGPEGLRAAVTDTEPIGDPEAAAADAAADASRAGPEPTPSGNPKPPPEPFPFTRCGDIEGTAEALDFVESLLTEGGASVVYGGSNTGKSFWALDLGACVATGRRFRGELEVDQGAVIYVCLEGTHGAKNRIAALKLAGLLPGTAPLFLVFAPVNLLEPGHADRLAATVAEAAKQSAMPCKLVILDTLARGMAGGDENSGRDMSQAVQAVDRVRAATGAHVMLIHHCGKNELLGARGHSSLRAAMDTEIEVFRPEGETVSTVKITKQRDMPLGEPMPFTLESVTLGTDRRGKPITSCTVRHEDPLMAATRGKPGRKRNVSLVDLLELLPQATTSEWAKVAKSEAGVSESAFYEALKKIKADKLAFKGTTSEWERR
jgi:hypothetical protein